MRRLAIATAFAAVIAAPAVAQSTTTLFYRNNPDGVSDDVYLGSYADRDALLAGAGQLAQASLQLNGQFGIGGLNISDQGNVSVLFYRKNPDGVSDDVYLGAYADRDALLAGAGQLTLANLQLNSQFGIGGMDISDQGNVSILFYRKSPEGVSDDVYLGAYADRDALLAGAGQLTQASWQLNGQFGIGGMSISDQGNVSLLFYRKSPEGVSDDVYLGAYADRDALLAGAGQLTQASWQLNGQFSMGGLDIADLQQPPPGVPEPASWALLIAGFGLVGHTARRRRPSAA